MTKKKILFVSAEMAPLAQSGGLGDVVGALPAQLRALGDDVRVILPLYKKIKTIWSDRLTFHRWSMIKLGWRTMYSGLLSMELDGVPVYFIDNEFYFGHDQLYVDYSFDIERFSFFQRAVLEALGDPMDFEPDILHLHDWQTGMIPCLLDAHYRPYGYHQQIKTILTIHNLKYQGIHGREHIADLMDLPDRYMTELGVLKDGVPNFLKSGIVYADRVTTVSPNYAAEIMTDYYGEGLDHLLISQAHKLTGILNGIDVEAYDPATDSQIARTYDRVTRQAGKLACKQALQEEIGLPQRDDIPLAVMISRLVDQKGIDLLLRVLDEMLHADIQVAVLGTGEAHYEPALREIAGRNPTRLAICLTYDTALSHRFYAGADLFLMPSLFEPCGLSQMIAMRYGTLPVVRETGGLKDTVIPYNEYTGEGNGFSFLNINAHELLYTVQRAAALWRSEPVTWQTIVDQAMSGDYSWQRSALEYQSLYQLLGS